MAAFMQKGFTAVSESTNEHTEPNYTVPHEPPRLDRDLQRDEQQAQIKACNQSGSYE